MRRKMNIVPTDISLGAALSNRSFEEDIAFDHRRSRSGYSSIQHESRVDAAVGEQPRLLERTYKELDVTLDAGNRTMWCYMKPHGRPSFTPTLLRELIEVRRSIEGMFATTSPQDEAPIQYFVGGSRLPGIYSLGGDLGYFVECIRARDMDGLRGYARDCIDVAYHMWAGFNVPVTTIALVQGDALGGGFEGALSFNVLVAERSTQFGLPEILFNLFPGMGAYSFLSRKLDAVRAERMIMSGRIYRAEELHDMGLIDVLAEDGQGKKVVREYIARNRRRHGIHQSIYEVRRRVHPLTFEELSDITEIWIEAALRLEEPDLRRMERLTLAQMRRAGLNGGALKKALKLP